MRVTQRGSLAVLAATTLAALAPASAGARIIEIGQTAQPTPPSCPTNPCQAVSRTTGYQAKVGTQRGLMAAPADGKIVAWTITLGSPGKRQIKFFNDNYGGASLAGISILKPGTKLFHRVLGQSPMQSLQPYFGTTVQFPLSDRAEHQEGPSRSASRCRAGRPRWRSGWGTTPRGGRAARAATARSRARSRRSSTSATSRSTAACTGRRA